MKAGGPNGGPGLAKTGSDAAGSGLAGNGSAGNGSAGNGSLGNGSSEIIRAATKGASSGSPAGRRLGTSTQATVAVFERTAPCPLPACAPGRPMSRNEQFAQFQVDAPACDRCGHITVRNGNCYLCHNCGNSMGCS